MAGIGFELKKIYRKEGISRSLVGALYSSAITIGPTLVVIATILLLYLILDMTRIGIADRELLSATILYIFIFAVSLDSPFNAIFSRYLADKFYMEEGDSILPSYYVGLLLTSALSMVIAIPGMWSLYTRGNVDLPFILGAFVLWASAVILFFSNTYLQGTKDYKIVALIFLVAMIIGGLSAIGLYRFTYWDQIHCILYGLAIGFFVIAFGEFAYIRNYFKTDSGSFTECLTYLWKYRSIFLTNLFYISGLYIHNFVMWTTPGRIVVANTFVCHQPYDMATCLAMFTNISITVIFTVIAETEFHEIYQKYMEAVIGGTYRLIQTNKRVMFHTLSVQLGQIFSLQVAITSLIFLFMHIFGITLGFSSLTMTIYPVLVVAYLGVFTMYCLIVYLYYFEDTTGSMLTAFLFFAATFVGMLFAKDLSPRYYGLGLIAGVVVSFTFAFFRLRSLERNFERHIFCRYRMMNTKKAKKKAIIIYKKEN